MRHNIDLRRFEIPLGDQQMAFLSYALEGTCATYEHTFVPDTFRGQGIAAELARGALDEARQRHWKIIPACSYIAEYIRRHPEFADLVEKEARP